MLDKVDCFEDSNQINVSLNVFYLSHKNSFLISVCKLCFVMLLNRGHYYNQCLNINWTRFNASFQISFFFFICTDNEMKK